MKLTAKTETWKEFVGVVDGIAALEARIHVDEDKVWYRTVDTANVAMAIAELPIESFSEHEVEPCSFCIDVAKFRTVFQFGGKDITVEMDTPTAPVIKIISGGYTYQQPLLHDATVKKDPNFPVLDLPGSVEMSGKEYGNAVKVSAIVSDKITLKIADGKFYLYAVGDTESEKLEKVIDDVYSVSGDAKSLFSKDYMIEMNRQLQGDIKIHLGNDFPFIIEFAFAGGHGTAKYLLAPRIEQE